MTRRDEPVCPMTLGNMRQNGVRDQWAFYVPLRVRQDCRACGSVVSR